MKTFLATLSMAAILAVSATSTSAFAASMDQAKSCNAEYNVCISGAANMSLKDRPAHWAGCNRDLAACYKM
jgi:hypothetical protein